MTPVLELVGLTKRYPNLTALESVDLTVAEGEIFALLGRNGAGKSTLIGCVTGLLKKTSGTVKLFGIDLDHDPITPRFKVGVVPQDLNIDAFFSPREVLRMQAGYWGLNSDRQRDDALLAALKLTSKADSPMRSLSGGMRRRLLVAKALVHRPKLLFLDEPTAGVDVELRRDLWAYVETLKSEGTTVVLTTHYLDEAERLADRVGIIDSGRLRLVEGKSSLMKRLGERRLEVRFASPVTGRVPPQLLPSLSPDGLQLTYVERPGTEPALRMVELVYASALPVVDLQLRSSSLEEVLMRVLGETGSVPKASAPLA